ncbi:MAG: potassium transporter Kup [Nitrosomonadales bacterium]|nr:MAG: potassium transporter Kup [Nitrosomonadales bacterium]
MSSTSNDKKSSLAVLTVGAVGIVYGDIGTSPLYAMKVVFSQEYGLILNAANLLGVVSLIVWGLIIIISIKYVTLILRADNRGEGGIMALMVLALSSVSKASRWYFPVTVMGLFGATLFYGDSVITPAISVLSAIEGLEVASPMFKPYVVPLAVAILLGLYLAQSRGTADIGRWFGPIMLIWFFVLAAMGIVNIIETPEILSALNPWHALIFLRDNDLIAFIALGAVVLAFTGAEALYADMSHFGAKPIRITWFFIAFPALTLNYLGQGGLLLSNPNAVSNPFYQQLGAWSTYPLVILSTVATIIAAQSTISGTFSMTKQAISLGYLPRMKIVHTSVMHIGQIYIPFVNWLQLTIVLLVVVGFGSSSSLASAYGIAVTATMLVTTILTFFVIRYHWRYNLVLCLFAAGFFLLIDFALFSANTLKILHGGWFPLLLGFFLFTIMLTWKRGRQLVFENLSNNSMPLKEFLQSLFFDPPVRVPGTAIFLRNEIEGVPHALLHNLSHNKVLHERVFFLTVYTREIPFVPVSERVQVESLGNQCYQISIQYGFKDEPNILQSLELCKKYGLEFNMLETSFFIARQTLIPTQDTVMGRWRELIFISMSRNAHSAADYYQIPNNRVIELGTQIEI